ncbi:MAG: LytTR family DNA-binding domain-containing protein [Bacteroidetes bacterium]|nr:LytTR family DNA-binding domain-containing protein [Bacteroidota bacterium]
MNCLLVDDEPLALDLLEDNIRQIPFLHLSGRCKNAFEAIPLLQQEKIDLIFLDIQMPGLTGIEFIRSFPNKPMVIFVSAYKQYASEGFDLDVLDYLVKPVSFERFLKSALKALDYFNLIKKAAQIHDYIFVNADYSLVKVMLDDILYIEGLKDYIKIHLSSQTKPIVTRLNMKTIEESLPTGRFLRIHKSFIVSVEKITSIRRNRILINMNEIPVSANYKTELLSFVDKKSLLPGNH